MRFPETSKLRELTVSECRALLLASSLGRLAITQHALPAVVPVWIRLVGDDVLLASLVGDAVPLEERGVVALQTGTLGQLVEQQGWSVEVVGILRKDPGRLLSQQARGISDVFRLAATNLRGWSATHLPSSPR